MFSFLERPGILVRADWIGWLELSPVELVGYGVRLLATFPSVFGWMAWYPIGT